MVDFTLTAEQQDMREMALDFAEKEFRPVAWDYDRDATWPQEIIEKAWDVGLMNSQLPERYGGAGASYLDGVLIGEVRSLPLSETALSGAVGRRARPRCCACPARRGRARSRRGPRARGA
jgi:acyl-CoA dehydrogenase